MKKQMKLRDSILITTVLIITTIILSLTYVSSRQFTGVLTERMVDDYQETVSTMQKNIETVITYMEDFTKYMALDEEVLETITEYQNMSEGEAIRNRLLMKQRWDELSTRLLYSTTMLYSLDVYSKDELIYSYYDDPIAEETKNIPEEIVKQALKENAPIWTDLLTLKQYRSYRKRPEYGFGVVKSVINEKGQKIGVISVFVKESSFSNILKPMEDEQKSRFYLVDSENIITSAVDKNELYENITPILGLSEEEYEECIKEGMLLKKQRGKTPVLYTSREMGESGLRLVCETTMEELGSQQRDLKIFSGIMMIVAVALAVIAAWLVAKRVTKPLNELMEIMEVIKTEDKNRHLRFPEGNKGEVGVLGSRFNELMDQLDKYMQQIYEEQRQRQHNEMRLLQAQISPHFLYNTMGTISSFIKLGMPDNALTAIQNLVNFYRTSLSAGKEIITVKEEVDLTRNYMALQQLRYIEYMEFSIDCTKEAEDFCVPKLTIQPLVENILHHGFKPNGEKCLIHVTVAFDEMKENLEICVCDNGAGFKPERLKQVRRSLKTGESVTKSFGLLNVNQRLRLIFGREYHMDIDSVEGEYTEITLYLPREYKNEGK